MDEGTGGIRRLPSLFVNDVQTYAGRDVGEVVNELRRTVEAFTSSAKTATYMLTACEVGDNPGLYGADFFNRSTYRRALRRLGMTFSKDQFVTFRDDGRFESSDRDPFFPRFIMLGAPPEGTEPATFSRAGQLLHHAAFYRIADIGEDELARLASVCAGVVGVTGGADAAMEAIARQNL